MVSGLGLDIGYGYTKGFSGSAAVAFRSVLAPVARVGFQFEGQSRLGVFWRDRLYVSGDEAYLYSSKPLEVRTREFIGTDLHRLLLYSALLRMDAPSNLLVVFGVPVGHWTRFREELVRYSGVHVVRTESAVRTFSLRVVSVMPQPAGTFFDLSLDLQGRLCSSELAQMAVGIVDVGYYTTDCVLVDRFKYVESHSGGWDYGVSVLADECARLLEDMYGVPFSAAEAEQVLRTGTVKLAGQLHSPSLDDVLSTFAERICLEVKNLWGSRLPKLDRIYVTGGGGALLFPYLVRLLPGAQLVQDSFMANARGFYKYAVLYSARRGCSVQEGASDAVAQP